MHDDLWMRALDLVGVVIELAPDERSSYLDRACHDEPELRREVDSLLAAHASGGGAFEEPVGQLLRRPLDASAPAGHEPSVAPGDWLGHYQVVAFIGAGGMGEVYRARDLRLDREGALKVLPSAFAADRGRLSRFEQEARAAAALNHPNICTVHDVGEANRRPYMAIELIEGDTLRVLSGHALARSRAAEVGAQAAKALAAAHAVGIIHRDIKPENLMLRPDGYVKVLDFGLARLPRPSQPFRVAADATGASVDRLDWQTDSSVRLGTVRYMSPEQVRGEEVQSATDIFSLGVVLYELATGQYPFEPKSGSRVLQAILDHVPVACGSRIADSRAEPSVAQRCVTTSVRPMLPRT
jgi:serine/threonine protein kinase